MQKVYKSWQTVGKGSQKLAKVHKSWQKFPKVGKQLAKAKVPDPVWDNLSGDDAKILKEIISDPTIIICPADKGKAIVIEDKQTYLTKMQEQIDEGDYKLESRKEKTLLDKLHKKLIIQSKSYGTYVPTHKSS